MRTKIIAICIITVLMGISGFMIYNSVKKNNLETNMSDKTMSSRSVVNEFIKDKQVSSTKYYHKKIKLRGKIKSIVDNQVILDNNVVCNLENQSKYTLKSDSLTITGEVIYFDDLMEELKLEHCIVVN